MKIDRRLTPKSFEKALERFFELSGKKIHALNTAWDPAAGSPVFTRQGKYTARGWTEWTQGFQFGCQILQFDATDDSAFFTMGRGNTIRYMAPHVSHIGVHDHGFNNISTYGNLRRLAIEGRTLETPDSMHFYEMALKVSGAVQAARWTPLYYGPGYIYSFNGPHSLFSDTIRSVRSLMLAHKLGHCLMGENDARISLLERGILHAAATAQYNVYYGEGRDRYDVRGRVAHESIFNTKDGKYRCPSTQQGYSPFTTWTRGLAWVILGYAEELECLDTFSDSELEQIGDGKAIRNMMLKAATATADFYIANTPADGVPYWDTGAPGLARMPRHLEEPSKPDNPYEPVDSSAAVISAQGLLRLGHVLDIEGEGKKYYQAGLTVAKTLFAPPYLSEKPAHHGLILHSVYHRPNGWDYVPRGKKVPFGESSMWGDYHAMELAVYLQREIKGGPYLTFFA
ncbi:MAG TPA: glycosyl hydrolase [Candidatus Hydrogenedentes bacterium]|nr:glycosyl hydrolase [Candidatus Hydrogenedentota bacterium]HQH52750.1 glycosyl hydrolase [Candidatus Hydrogenedentota bacterium]HQM49794.1 glycosyl hydrolase [Candidatus Hydrogenedentota bacterium]